MAKVMFSLPEKLVSRMKSSIPPRERSKVLLRLLEGEIAARERALYQRAMELEGCKGLKKEMTAWDTEFGKDGLDEI